MGDGYGNNRMYDSYLQRKGLRVRFNLVELHPQTLNSGLTKSDNRLIIRLLLSGVKTTALE